MVNLETLLADISNGTPHFVLITGDFNAKFRNWSTNDTANAEGAYLDFLMTLYGLNKLITKPTSILEHFSSSINLVFTNQPNLVSGSAIHPTLHSKCYDLIIYSKLNLEV